MSEITRIPIRDDSFLKEEIFDPSAEFKSMDLFNREWNEVRKFSGIDQNFKRRADRLIEKQQMSDAYMDSALATQGGREDAKSKAINPGVVYRNAYGLFDVITPPYNLNELANYYDTSFANHAAIDAKVENTVGLGYDFVVSKNTMMKLEDIDDKEKLEKTRKKIGRLKIQTRDWLESLNDDESFTSVLEKVMTDVNATGNGYIEIGRTIKGEIGYVGHIPSTTMRVRRLHDGFVQMIGNKVTYFRNFGANNPNPITGDKRPNEIIHIKEYSPLNTFYGVPDVIAAMPALIGDSLAAQYNIDYFQNKAVPRYIVTLKGAQLSAEAEDKLFRFLQTGLKGQNHRTLYIPLPGDSDSNKVDFKMEPIESGVQEASFNDYRVRNRDDILIAHQVPLSKIGGGDSSAVAAAIAQDRTFKEQVTRPEQTKLEKVLNKIIREKTDILEIKFNELTLTDEVAQSQIDERYVRNKVITPNEVRERIGLPQVEGGDKMVEQSPRQMADAKANSEQNRERDAERVANQSDGEATTTGRNPKGEGRSTE